MDLLFFLSRWLYLHLSSQGEGKFISQKSLNVFIPWTKTRGALRSQKPWGGDTETQSVCFPAEAERQLAATTRLQTITAKHQMFQHLQPSGRSWLPTRLPTVSTNTSHSSQHSRTWLRLQRPTTSCSHIRLHAAWLHSPALVRLLWVK